MEKRGATSEKAKNLGLRRAFVLVVPLVLAGSAWKVADLQKPVEVEIPSPGLQRHKGQSGFSVKEQKIPAFQQLIDRLLSKSREHPFASSISISQTTPWPKESGLDLSFSDYLEWNRKKQTLQYGADNYGWVYSRVEKSGLQILADSHLEAHPISLPTALNARLSSFGWTLSEHYLP